ncbi:13544_t:CDS:2, partial [Entrophospora sp. SA101]
MSALDINVFPYSYFSRCCIAIEGLESLTEHFEWKHNESRNLLSETSPSNKKAYLTYIQTILFPNYNNLKIMEAPPHLLDVDAAIMLPQPELLATIELKPNFQSNNIYQAIVQFISANIMFTPSNHSHPLGVLTGLNDKWVLIWGSENGYVNYAITERLSNGEIVNLTAETAVWYVRYILEEVSQALNIEMES